MRSKSLWLGRLPVPGLVHGPNALFLMVRVPSVHPLQGPRLLLPPVVPDCGGRGGGTSAVPAASQTDTSTCPGIQKFHGQTSPWLCLRPCILRLGSWGQTVSHAAVGKGPPVVAWGRGHHLFPSSHA